ncbi:MAG: hypothetical protein SCALA702_31490 [Melioribacteraceae bacterium]|nr:MAG: hypothetical protein SCALA702_31490 [Melioribacteraceae bacterium]
MLDNIRLNSEKYFVYGGDNERKFNYPEINISDSLEFVWNNDLNGSQWTTSLTIMDNLLIAADLSGRVTAFDLKTGKDKGVLKNDGGIFHQPAVYKNKLHFVVNNDKEEYSTLVYYDFINNKTVIEHQIEGNVRNELLLDEKYLFMLTDRGVLHKYNPVGNEIFSTKTEGITQTSPILVGKMIVFANISGEIIFIDKETGKIEIRKKIAKSIQSNLSSDGKNIYTGTAEGDLICFNIKSAEILWKTSLDSKIFAIPSISDEKIFIGTLGGKVYSINKITGDIVWEYDTSGLVNNAIFVGKNNILVPDLNRKLHILSKQDGSPKSIVNFESRVKTTPIFHDSLFYIGYDKGNIAALRGI